MKVLGRCERVVHPGTRPCGASVVRVGYPPHGGPYTEEHGYLYHSHPGVGVTCGGGEHSPVLAGVPNFLPGPRCTVPGHDH